MKYLDLIILGDFNLHLNDVNDLDAEQFLDLLDMHGLAWHRTGPTHTKGNILDLIISSTSSDITLHDLKLGPYLSDHHVLDLKLDILKGI